MNSENTLEFFKSIQTADVKAWITDTHSAFTMKEFCSKFDIDVENDCLNKCLWQIGMSREVYIDELLLENLGYTGRNKFQRFAKFLRENTDIKYFEGIFNGKRYCVEDDDDSIKCIVITVVDFENILDDEKFNDLRVRFKLMQLMFIKYREYEIAFENLCRHPSPAPPPLLGMNNALREREFLKLEISIIEQKSIEEREFLKSQSMDIREQAAKEFLYLQNKITEIDNKKNRNEADDFEREVIRQNGIEFGMDVARECEFIKNRIGEIERTTTEKIASLVDKLYMNTK